MITTCSAMSRSRATAAMPARSSISSLLSILTSNLPLVKASISRSVDTVSSVTLPLPSTISRHCFSSATVLCTTSPLQLVVRSSQLSCITTYSPSFDLRTSISTISTPSATELSTPSKEFSGCTITPFSIQPPRCATIITWSRHWLACSNRSRIWLARVVSAKAGAACARAAAASIAPKRIIRIQSLHRRLSDA